MLAKAHGERVDYLRRRLIFGEEAPEFPRDEGRAGRLSREDIDHVIAIQRRGVAHEFLDAAVVLPRREARCLVEWIKAIAGEGARRFAHIVFAIVTDRSEERRVGKECR